MQEALNHVYKVDLFDNEIDGYISVRIPAITVTASGAILAFAVGRTRVSDWSESKILMRRSIDGGCTWAPSVVVAELAGSVVDNPVPIVDAAKGCIHFLYQTDYKRVFYTCSTDDGMSFAPPTDITSTFEQFKPEYDWTVIAPGPGHGIKLANGRLLVPIWMASGIGTAHHPSCVSVIYSDDAGKTWSRGEIAVHNTELTPNPSETVAIELQDGSVMLNVRNESRKYRRAITVSQDGATGWGAVTLVDGLYEPICCAGLVRAARRNATSQKVQVFSNPASSPGEAGKLNQPRTNLTIRISYDDGATWPVAKLLEEGMTGYSDLAADSDGNVYCIYESGSASAKTIHPRVIRFARFPIAWVIGV